MHKQQSSMLSPWEQEWAQVPALGRGMAQARAAQVAPAILPEALVAAAVGRLLLVMALTRTSKLAWTTSGNLERARQVSAAESVLAGHAAYKSSGGFDCLRPDVQKVS